MPSPAEYVKQTKGNVPIATFTEVRETLQTHTYNKSKLRSCFVNGNQWFFAVDVVTALGYPSPNLAIRDYVKDKNKMRVGGQCGQVIIDDCGLIALVSMPKNPIATKYRDWLYATILASVEEPKVTKKKEVDEKKFNVADENVIVAEIKAIEEVAKALGSISQCDVSECIEVAVEILNDTMTVMNGKNKDTLVKFIKSKSKKMSERKECNANENKRTPIVTQTKERNVARVLTVDEVNTYLSPSKLADYIRCVTGRPCKSSTINDFLEQYGYQKCKSIHGGNTRTSHISRVFVETELAVRKDLVRCENGTSKLFWNKDKVFALMTWNEKQSSMF